ncbi:MAG: site-2 protease family protein [Planctomycetota bacterium]
MNPASYWAILKVAIGLGAVIFVHELGHFLLAKACGVKCDKFYVGFDVPIKMFGQTILPAKLIHWKWGETEYGIGAIPLGGYVKMMGQDDNPGNIEEQVKESLTDGESTESAFLPSGLVDQTKLDPRSYLAKSVVQRMMIISAGVIFNLIFAVIFATVAFKSGVDYQPAMVGNVIGSGPAWVNDLAGADVTRIGDQKVEGYFPYMEMAESIVFNSSSSTGTVDLEYIPYGQNSTTVASMSGEKGLVRDLADLPFIGVSPPMKPVVGDPGAIEGEPAENANPPFEVGDKIISINDTPIETDIDLRTVLARDADLPAEFVLERKDGQQVTTTVEPKKMKRLGFELKWMPITHIQVNSPAMEAGIQVGDEVVSIDGEPRGDILTVDKRMMPFAKTGKVVEVIVNRNGDEQKLELVPTIPKTLSVVGPNRAFAIDTLGIALPVEHVIENIVPGSSAEKEGLKPGDKLLSVEWILSDEQRSNARYSDLKKRPKSNFELDKVNWPEVAQNLQSIEAGTKLKFTYTRKEVESQVTLENEESDAYFDNRRGIALTFLKKHYVASTWGEAFQYGYKQVGKDMTRVLKTLAKLVKGEISAKNLGGPGTIAMVATSEASEGTSRLLLFLTFLSANLAIVNFLPIPVLDGGHMMFLAYEGAFKRPVSERVQMVLTYSGLIIILGLMLFVLTLDATRIWGMF